jgi:hypothetical protein
VFAQGLGSEVGEAFGNVEGDCRIGSLHCHRDAPDRDHERTVPIRGEQEDLRDSRLTAAPPGRSKSPREASPSRSLCRPVRFNPCADEHALLAWTATSSKPIMGGGCCDFE